MDLYIGRLLKKHGFRGMFYIPTLRHPIDGLDEDEIKTLAKDHDIGFHSYSHPSDLKDSKDIEMEVTKGKDKLEKLIGRKITSFCYPKGRYNEEVIEALKRHGYTEGRTVDVGKIENCFEPFRKPTTMHFRPDKKEWNGFEWLPMAKNLFLEAQMLEERGYFHAWGHASELNKFRIWREFDELLAFMEENL